jgi:hypothetical protein
MYADDSTIHISGENISDIQKKKSKKTWLELNYGARIIICL